MNQYEMDDLNELAVVIDKEDCEVKDWVAPKLCLFCLDETEAGATGADDGAGGFGS